MDPSAAKKLEAIARKLSAETSFGAIAVHDHCDSEGPNDPPAAVCDSDAKQQNYKLVGWREVKAALGIR